MQAQTISATGPSGRFGFFLQPGTRSQVLALNDLTGERHTVESNATGDYIFTALPVGEYRTEAKASRAKFWKEARNSLQSTEAQRVIWCARRDSNSRPTGSKPAALSN
jgi:hypothetical protein